MQIMSLYIFVNDGVRNSTKLMEREGKQREDCEFEVSLDYIVKPYFKEPQRKSAGAVVQYGI